jgi:hypothetical protein
MIDLTLKTDLGVILGMSTAQQLNYLCGEADDGLIQCSANFGHRGHQVDIIYVQGSAENPCSGEK